MLDLKLEKVKLMDLVPRDGNPNQMSDTQLQSLEYSIDKFGYIQPIVVNQNNQIIDGYHRFCALSKHGSHQQVEVVRVNIESEADLKLLSQTMNKLRGSHDLKKDITEMEILLGHNPDELKSLLGFDETGLDLMRQQLVEEEEEQASKLYRGQQKEESEADLEKLPTPEEIKEPITKTGDIWKLGNHYLLCGDCTVEKDIDKILGDVTPTLILTDPPYGIGYDYNTYEDVKGDEYLEFCRTWFPLIKSKSDLCIITTGWKYKGFWYSEFPPDDEMIWFDKTKQSGGRSFFLRKTEPIMIWGKVKNKFVWDIIERQTDRGDGMKDLHTCPKPVSLMSEIIEKQTSVNNIVFDPFLGSGSTLISCEQYNRICCGIELDARYCDIAVQRWENYTGLKAEKL